MDLITEMCAMVEVLECHDLLVRVLCFAPTPFDLERCGVVNTAFRAASATSSGGLLAARTAARSPLRRRYKSLGRST